MGSAYPYRLASYEETKKLNPNGNTKFRCPVCGDLSFTPYIYADSGQAIDARSCGYCDHVNGCGYHVKPAEYFSINPDARRKLSKEEFAEQQRKHRESLRHEAELLRQRRLKEAFGEEVTPEPADSFSIPFEFVLPSLTRNEEANLFKFLCSKFEPEKVSEAFKLYKVGTDKKGRTIFWQIDKGGTVRTGKIIQYSANGHRAKNSAGGSVGTNWAHALLKKAGRLPESWQLRQCMFGEHLLNNLDKYKGVVIVEAEKSAIIGSIVMPQFLWLGLGGIQQFKQEMLRPLIGTSSVQVIPDLGAFELWKQKADSIKGISLVVADYLEQVATEKARAKGMDIADYFLNEF